MASLKELRGRIKSIKSTQKLVGAMKMVSAAKLRRSQERLDANRPYAEKVEGLVKHSLSQDLEMDTTSLLQTGGDGCHLIFLVTSERGLCGSYNSLLIRETKRLIKELSNAQQSFRLAIVGRKGFEALSLQYKEYILPLSTFEEPSKAGPSFKLAQAIGGQMISWLQDGTIGTITVIRSAFKNVLTQSIHRQDLVPFSSSKVSVEPSSLAPFILIEPQAEDFLPELLKHNLISQIYNILLENLVCEHAARMTAMDSANRNAREMVQKLQLTYNRTRQAYITSELIEIISGAQDL